jgi:hypothetical protein
LLHCYYKQFQFAPAWFKLFFCQNILCTFFLYLYIVHFVWYFCLSLCCRHSFYLPILIDILQQTNYFFVFLLFLLFFQLLHLFLFGLFQLYHLLLSILLLRSLLLPPWWIHIVLLSYLVYHFISLLISLNFQSNFGPY